MADHSGEIWRPVPGFDGYEVSDQGGVRSYHLPGGHKMSAFPRKRSIKPGGHGYCGVTLRKDGLTFYRRVHRLVMAAFVGQCPEGLEVCHNNGNPGDNRLSNLRYDTSGANKQDSIAHGTAHRHLAPKQVAEIRLAARQGDNDPSLATQFGVSLAVIRGARSGRTYAGVEAQPVAKRQGTKKLSAEKAKDVYRAVSAGSPRSEIAEKYHITKSLISLIMNGRRWAPATAQLRAKAEIEETTP